MNRRRRPRSGFIHAASGDAGHHSGRPRRPASDSALQTVVDSAWSRRYRWRTFRPVRELTAKYNADKGRLPLLLRRYADETMLQPYLDTKIPDMRLWTELGIAADHADYIAFILFTNISSDTRSTSIDLDDQSAPARGSRRSLMLMRADEPLDVAILAPVTKAH